MGVCYFKESLLRLTKMDFISNSMKICTLVLSVLLVNVAQGQAPTSDAKELLKHHQTVLQAHVTGDVAAWLAVEADTTISVHDGAVTYLTRNERKASRAAYLGRTTFEVYRDLSSPIVRLSEDGTLGWIIAEVETVGWAARADGTIEDISEIWAWIELYQKSSEGWQMTGNVSNRRP